MNKESGMQARYYDCKLNHVKLIMSTLHEIKFIIDRVCLVIRSLFKKTKIATLPLVRQKTLL